MDEEDEDNGYTKYLSLIGVPFLLVVAPLCGYFIGDWLDMYFNTSPYLAYIFLALGIFAAIREFYKLVKQFGDDDHTNH